VNHEPDDWPTELQCRQNACPVCAAPAGQLCVPSFGMHRKQIHFERLNGKKQGDKEIMKVGPPC